MKPNTPECPGCKQAALPRAENSAFPFCSQRCKAIDLGRWLGAEYRIPAEPDEDEDGNSPPEVPRSDA